MLGCFACADGRVELGVRLMSCADRLADRMHFRLAPRERRRHAAACEQARAALGADAYDRARGEGEHWALADAVAAALDDRASRITRPLSAWSAGRGAL